MPACDRDRAIDRSARAALATHAASPAGGGLGRGAAGQRPLVAADDVMRGFRPGPGGASRTPPRDRARGPDRLDPPGEPVLVRGARLAADDRPCESRSL